MPTRSPPSRTFIRRSTSVSIVPRPTLCERRSVAQSPAGTPIASPKRRKSTSAGVPGGGTVTMMTRSGGTTVPHTSSTRVMSCLSQNFVATLMVPCSGSRTLARYSGQSSRRPITTLCCQADVSSRARSRTVSTTWTRCGARASTSCRAWRRRAPARPSSENTMVFPWYATISATSRSKAPVTGPSSPVCLWPTRSYAARRCSRCRPPGNSTPAPARSAACAVSACWMLVVPVLGSPTCRKTSVTVADARQPRVRRPRSRVPVGPGSSGGSRALARDGLSPPRNGVVQTAAVGSGRTSFGRLGPPR